MFIKKLISGLVLQITNLISWVISRIITPGINISKKIYLPGFRGVPLFDVAYFFIRGMRKSSITLRANSISYSFIIAFVPAVMFLFTLIPYIPVPGIDNSIMLSLKEMIPEEAFRLLNSTIEDIVRRQQTGLLSISFLISLYFASNGVIAIMNAFNQTFHAIESRSYIKKHIVALLLVIILAITMIITGAALSLSSRLIDHMEAFGMINDSYTWLLLVSGKWIIILLTSLIAFSSIYYFAPARKRIFPFFSAGSITASLLSVVSLRIFTFFIDNFSNYNRFYGSLGTIVMLIVWINLTSLVLLIGFELNASIYIASRNKSSAD